ncbi:MAG: hypothetical protein OXQ94_00600 [Gemmatimonadota bacterium]|nr:hypothetical protein [Gemmatimonadota bacterium]MDE2870179.1 hypothetical protein [Gemmatimonadota bacterium]
MRDSGGAPGGWPQPARRSRGFIHGLLTLLPALTLLVPAGTAQTVGTMPGTLRYGSGLLDIPVASVLPHMAFTATWSGFRVSVAETVVPDDPGATVPPDRRFERWFSDGSLALGLFGRLEVGTSLQHFAGADRGGKVLGTFGRLALIRPRGHGLGLAAGFRHLTSPSFGDESGEVQPNRLGYPDWRVTREAAADGKFGGNFSPYLVATALLPGVAAGPATHDVTLHLGWGGGLFSAGPELDFYQDANSGGIFGGAAIHYGLGGGRLLNLMADFNGFDANAGVQLDLGGVRLGAFALGLQHDGTSTFRSRKFGLLGSVVFCGGRRTLCRGERKPAPDTVTLPAPPPDTVVIVRETAAGVTEAPEGTPETLCLATGKGVEVRVTTAGDTLVGPSWASIGELRPGLVFAGSYAGDRAWFIADEPVRFEDRLYAGTGGDMRLNCDEIVRVGEYAGVPVFADRSAEPPLENVHVPRRPGIWRTYRHR